MKVPPSFIPTVPGIPRICDTSRAGSAGTSGIGVRVGVWGWETTVALSDTVRQPQETTRTFMRMI